MTIDSTANRKQNPGEMVRQSIVAARDSDCFPQGLIRLVGYRHPDARPFSWIRARPLISPSVAPGFSDENVPIG